MGIKPTLTTTMFPLETTNVSVVALPFPKVQGANGVVESRADRLKPTGENV